MTARRLEILSPEECLDLLGTQSLGRVAVRIGESPTILPVRYALLDGEVVFRSDPGTKLFAALMKTLVAFEVDDVDPATGAAWSVLVVGHAEEIREQATRERVDALDLEPWIDGGRDFVVRVRTETVTGRRLPAPETP